MRHAFAAAMFAAVFIALPSAPPANGAARERSDVERELREHAGRNLPGSKRELACFLYLTAAENSPQAQEAYTLMRSEAEAGDSIAALYVSAYLRKGFGTAASGAAARAFLNVIQDDIGPSQLPPLTSLQDAADALKSGRCAPVDEEGAAELYTVRPAITPL